jgi:hypothetical protein
VPLELATRLILRNSEDGSPLREGRLRELVAEWAGVPAAATESITDGLGRGGSRVATHEERLPESPRCKWDLTLMRNDDDDQGIEWKVAATAMFDSDRTTFVVRLRRDARDHRIRPLLGAPAPPRVIRDVLEAPGVECFDGPLRVEPRYRRLSASSVDGFVQTQLVAEDRRLPILAIATLPPAADNRLDAATLVRDLAGFAHVVLVDRAALPAIGRQLANLSLAPASLRLWWPGLELDDESAAHPYWTGPFASPSKLGASIRQRVLQVSRDRWREPTRLAEFDRELRHQHEEAGRQAAARVVAELSSLRSAAAAAREEAQKQGQEDAAAAAERSAYETRLSKMANDLESVRLESDRIRLSADHAEAQWAEAEEEKEKFQRENRALEGRLDGALAQLRARAADEDEDPPSAEEVFRREVVEAWESQLTDDDRSSHPIATFVVRDGFPDSITRAGADRQKVVDTVMQVACGLAQHVAARQVHKLRTGPSGGAPDRRRAADNAQAWRCSIQTNTPQARRLHYWSPPGTAIEFACVVMHDDFSIGE